MCARVLALLALLALSHGAAARFLQADAPAPEPAATPDGVPSTLAVAFDGAGCLAKGLPEGVDWPFFAPGEEPPTDATLAGTFTREGLAPEAAPICAQLPLFSPCTERFLALRSPGADRLWLRPAVSVSVAAAPGCEVSHCQGGVLTLEGGAGNGTFTQRKDLSVSYTAQVEPSASEGVAVTLDTPLGPCTLLFSGDARALE